MTNEKMCDVMKYFAENAKEKNGCPLENDFFEECDRQLNAILRKLGYDRKQYTFDAEDYKQDVMLKLLISAKTFVPEKGKFSTWFNKVATTTFIKKCEKEQKQLTNQAVPMFKETEDHDEVNQIDQFCSEMSAEEVFFQKERREHLYREIENLGENQRNAVWLVDICNMKPREAAEVMHLSGANVSTLLNRGHKKLREQLEKEQSGDERELGR